MPAKRKYLPGDPRAEQEALEGIVLDAPRGPRSEFFEPNSPPVVIQGEVLDSQTSARSEQQPQSAGSRTRSRTQTGPSARERRAARKDARSQERLFQHAQKESERVSARQRRQHWGYQDAPLRQARPVPPFVPAGEHASADQLMRDIAEAENQYMKGVEQSKLFSEDFKGSVGGEIASQHKRYVTMMMFSAVQPLAQGMTAANIARCIGLATVMWKLSPEFKGMVGEGAGAVKDALGDMAEKWVGAKATKYDGSGKARFMGLGREKAEVWQSRLDRMRSMRDGDRLPFTAHSAGMAEVALGDRAYAEMRLPGADAERIMAEHADAVNKLYAMADYDGVSADEVAKSARVVVGQRIMADPRVSARYSELARGDFVMAPEKEVVTDLKTGETMSYWDGAYQHTSGAIINGGTFGVRMPQSPEQHSDEIYKTIYLDLVTSAENVDEFHGKFMTYGLGWAGMPDDEIISKLDRDSPGRHRFESSMSMMQAMADDGVSQDEAQLMYTSALTDALDLVQQQFPQIAVQWEQKYETSWRETVNSMVRNPSDVRDFWERADQRSRGEERSSTGPRGTYSTRDHQSSQSYSETRTAREYPGPGRTQTSATSTSTAGWAGSDPSNAPTRETQVDVSEMARRNEIAKRNQRYNQPHRDVLAVLDTTADITGAGIDAPEPDEPQP